jgi:hypothetical protein
MPGPCERGHRPGRLLDILAGHRQIADEDDDQERQEQGAVVSSLMIQK